ncbi:MAG TPA: hypothetical protein VHA12_02840 [Candidatus Nanoarchaeia archaeon]|nr:hypothetical protein [Candidatus Nanoarchaeia archaeon]
MAEKRVKMALIAGAAHALEFKRKHPNASEDDAIQDVSRNADHIAKKLDI